MANTSANTENTICQQVCSTGTTGTAVVTVIPPHPVFSDLTGGTVTQLNLVQLGGLNGLYA
jgi:hypothetical protein